MSLTRVVCGVTGGPSDCRTTKHSNTDPWEEFAILASKSVSLSLSKAETDAAKGEMI